MRHYKFTPPPFVDSCCVFLFFFFFFLADYPSVTPLMSASLSYCQSLIASWLEIILKNGPRIEQKTELGGNMFLRRCQCYNYDEHNLYSAAFLDLFSIFYQVGDFVDESCPHIYICLCGHRFFQFLSFLVDIIPISSLFLEASWIIISHCRRARRSQGVNTVCVCRRQICEWCRGAEMHLSPLTSSWVEAGLIADSCLTYFSRGEPKALGMWIMSNFPLNRGYFWYYVGNHTCILLYTAHWLSSLQGKRTTQVMNVFPYFRKIIRVFLIYKDSRDALVQNGLLVGSQTQANNVSSPYFHVLLTLCLGHCDPALPPSSTAINGPKVMRWYSKWLLKGLLPDIMRLFWLCRFLPPLCQVCCHQMAPRSVT